MKFLISTAAFVLVLAVPMAAARPQAPVSIRLVDLNGDQRRDQIVNWADGRIEVSLGIGQRRFERLPQNLPKAIVTEWVVADLNGDEFTDLYLVTSSSNFALVGNGQGLFEDATIEMGAAGDRLDRPERIAIGEVALSTHHDRDQLIGPLVIDVPNRERKCPGPRVHLLLDQLHDLAPSNLAQRG